ncbi:MAG TPA: anti-sigma factor, partial [Gemmatimonadales bacterium]
REVAALLALVGPDDAPGDDLRERVLSRIEGERVHRKIGRARPRIVPVLWGAIAASLLATAGLTAAFLSLRKDVSRLEQTLADSRGQLAQREAILDRILEPGVELYQLTASGDPTPGIQLFWDRARNRAIIHGYRLKQVPAGRAYQLWFIKDGKPVPSVTFKPEPTGQATVEQVAVPTDGKVSAAAITVEPEAGSQQPTSPIMLVGALEKS